MPSTASPTPQPAFGTEPPEIYQLFSLRKSARAAREKKKSEPLCEGSRALCLAFISRSVRHDRKNFDDFILLKMNDDGEFVKEKWKTTEVPL